MNDTDRYTHHYLKQLSAATGDNGHIEMSESSQSGGVGLGNANSITSRYLIPSSINSKKAVVSVDVHGAENTNIRKRKRGVRNNKQKSNSASNRGKRRTSGKNPNQKGGRRVYKGGGKAAPKQTSRRKVGRFDNLKDNY